MLSYQNQDSAGTAIKDNDLYETSNVIETRMLYLSTKSSQCTQLNGDMKSRVQYDLKGYLDFQGDDTIQTVTLAMPYAILVNSNYQINSTNNYFEYILNGTLYFNTFLPFGNYTADSFITSLLAIMNPPNPGWSLTLNEVTGRFTLAHSSLPFSITSNSTVNYIMGFSSTLTAISDIGGGYYIYLPRVCNFLPNPLFRICVENNSFYNGQVLGANGSLGYSNVLASIPNTTKQFTQIVYQNFADEFATQLSGQTNLIIGILDDNGNYVDFNGISSYFQLRVRIYRRVKRSLKTFNQVLGGATNLRNEMEENAEGIEKPIDEII